MSSTNGGYKKLDVGTKKQRISHSNKCGCEFTVSLKYKTTDVKSFRNGSMHVPFPIPEEQGYYFTFLKDSNRSHNHLAIHPTEHKRYRMNANKQSIEKVVSNYNKRNIPLNDEYQDLPMNQERKMSKSDASHLR
jgi:hypothetical protein